MNDRVGWKPDVEGLSPQRLLSAHDGRSDRRPRFSRAAVQEWSGKRLDWVGSRLSAMKLTEVMVMPASPQHDPAEMQNGH
jgi:hypothetical protein